MIKIHRTFLSQGKIAILKSHGEFFILTIDYRLDKKF